MAEFSIEFQIMDVTIVKKISKLEILPREEYNIYSLTGLLYTFRPKEFILKLKLGEYEFLPDRWDFPSFFFNIYGLYFEGFEGIMANVLGYKNILPVDKEVDDVPALKMGQKNTFLRIGSIESSRGFWLFYDETDRVEAYPRSYETLSDDKWRKAIIPPFEDATKPVAHYMEPIILSKKQILAACYKYVIQHIKALRDALPETFNDEYDVLEEYNRWKEIMQTYKAAIEKL